MSHTILDTTHAAKAIQAASDAYALKAFIGKDQLRCLRDLAKETTEEHEHFRDLLRKYIVRIETMPIEYQNQGDAPLVYLHYFTGSCDWYILEKDSDPDGEGQIQCFGYANLGDPQNAELGYINIKELIACNAELDLYWKPQPLAPIKEKIEARR